MDVSGKRVLITGGTGSLGQAVVRRILGGSVGTPAEVIVFSRDEAKQHYMRLSYLHVTTATDEIIYRNSKQLLRFQIGDMRDYASVQRAVARADVIIHAAALKQVPTCEYFPFEATHTNIIGAGNLVRAVAARGGEVESVVGISTDKACKPVNVMGMTKAVMERILVEANLQCPGTRFACVRYGNVIASRGSVVPLFLSQIAAGGPVTITDTEMTRFLLPLEAAVDTVVAALRSGRPGDTYVPRVPAARIVDVAKVLIGDRAIPMAVTGVRPGEKLHEIMVSEEECHRTIERGDYYVIEPMLPELRRDEPAERPFSTEYSSATVTLDRVDLGALLAPFVTGQPNAAAVLA
jgi:FlaA1/EpsC-like NDP-sugar epimerase